MKIVIPGGSGQVGTALARAFSKNGEEVVVLSRGGLQADHRIVQWDGKTLNSRWVDEIDGSDVIIGLAGRSVNCRYNETARREIMDSRVDSVRVLGEAIAKASSPPKVWLQSSTATIYAHSFDKANDDITGKIGGNEPGAPETWNFSIDVATAWERATVEAETTRTRKVLMRSAMTMGTGRGGIFDTMLGLVRKGLGGTAGNGKQFISWIHEDDFINAVRWLIDHEELSGPINLASPNPLPNREFMRIFRDCWGTSLGLPAMEWQLAIGAWLMGTETELILKSRRVVPRRITDSGFKFEFPHWLDACCNLCEHWRKENK
ncbi:MAG: TIGR01777 family oxidoreductase [Pyrinomonadaceae bacterium]